MTAQGPSGSSGVDGGTAQAETDAKTVFERIDDGVFAVDADWVFTFLNGRAEEMLGVDADDVLGRNIWEVFSPATGTAFQSHYEQAMETQEQVTFEAYYDPLDSWFEATAYPDDDGLSVYFRDVTDRVQRERELEVYETGVNAAGDIIYRLDPDGNYTMVNDQLVERTGYDREELLGEHVSMMMDDDTVAEAQARIQRALSDDRTDLDPMEFELECADGSKFPVEATIDIIREDGQFVGTVGVSRDITERRQREADLERYEEVVAAVDDVVYALDDEGKFEVVNETITDLTGYTPEELLGEHVGIIKNSETVEAAEDSLRSLLQGEVGQTTFEFPLQHKDGSSIPCEDHMTVRYDDGEFDGTAGVIRDVTDQHERQRKLSGLVETTRELMTAPDRQAVAERTLAAAHDVLGFELSSVRLYDAATETLETAAITDLASEEMADRPTYDADEGPSGDAFESGETLVYQDFTSLDDGVDRDPAKSAMWVPLGEYGVLIAASTERDAFDELDRQVAEVLASSAATACTRAVREQEIRRERAFTEALVDSLPDVMYAFDEHLDYVRWNDRLLDVTGYTDEEITDLDPTALLATADETDIRDILSRAFDGEDVRLETDLVTKDGTTIPYELTAAPVRDTEGDVETVVGIGRDVSERLERERELERQNARLERFASTVSHDLRNPLKMAKSNLQMAQHEVESALLEDVAAAHERMEELIEDLLALARQGQAVDETERLWIGSVAKEAWDHIDAPGATLDTEGDITAEADEQRLLQAFENLFRNSVEHGSTGSRTQSGDSVEHAGDDVHIRVGPTDDGFFVADDGPGIPDDERDAVFEYGYTTTATGTGLGLAIVQEVFDAHGWTVSLGESESGGVRFDVTT